MAARETKSTGRPAGSKTRDKSFMAAPGNMDRAAGNWSPLGPCKFFHLHAESIDRTLCARCGRTEDAHPPIEHLRWVD